MSSREPDPSRKSLRLWLASIIVIVLVIAVWKLIDYRMRPPPAPLLPQDAAADSNG